MMLARSCASPASAASPRRRSRHGRSIVVVTIARDERRLAVGPRLRHSADCAFRGRRVRLVDFAIYWRLRLTTRRPDPRGKR